MNRIDKIISRARMIYRRAVKNGAQQVRFYRGRIISFRHPPPRDYGVRGVLIGIYTAESQPEWIEDDLLEIDSSHKVLLCD